MVDSAAGTRTGDANGLSLMLGDSHHASNTYGMTGATFTNVPKSKFLFFVKFYRPAAAGGSDWQTGLPFVVKNIDRPRISFKTETLNQYNRKRIVQTSHEFETLQLRFHDTVNPALQRMFVEYYQYYYGDSKVYDTGGQVVYDVVTGEPYKQGSWGFLPPLEAQNYGYFFSHIEVYQLYAGMMEKFTLINPKISSYNPDDFDYSIGNVSNEIQMSVDFEGISYSAPEKISAAKDSEFGLDRGLYWNVENDVVDGLQPGMSQNPNENKGDFAGNVWNALKRNAGAILDGDFDRALASVAGAYDANRGLAVGASTVNSIKDIVNGKTGIVSGTKTVNKLLKGTLFGKPGGLF